MTTTVYTQSEIDYAVARARETLRFDTDGNGVWKATGFDGTQYSLVPWGSLRKAFASVGSEWNAIDLGIVGSIAEGNQVIRSHSESLPFEIDEWTGLKVGA